MILSIEANKFSRSTMIQVSRFDGYEYVISSLDEILTTADDSEKGYFVDVDMKNANNLK